MATKEANKLRRMLDRAKATSNQAQRAKLKAEDSLTALEDREQRRRERAG